MTSALTRLPALLPKLRDGYRKLRETDSQALLWRPHALWNHLRFTREAEAHPALMRALPSSVEIELTNRCNLACIQCLRSLGLKPYQLGDVDFDDYRRMLAQFPQLVSICLNGFGEPLMHPRFLEIVAYTRATLPGTKITIYSNGMLLVGELLERLPGSGLSEINVSIDAATPETYRKVRRGGELAVVHANLRALLAARRRAGSLLPRVGVNFVLLNENEGELVRFVEQAAELGVDFVNCITYATYDWGFVNRRSPESYRTELAQAARRLSELGLTCRSFPSDDLSWADPARAFSCEFFWGRSLRVTYAGEVTLGCCTPFKETYSYGNILQTPFEELWNGPLFRVNRALASHAVAPHKSCSDCADQARQFFAPRAPELVQLRRKVVAR
jgi:MoaA/NifB/PqqE/SkfB family radical SAM enzyme